MAKSLIVIFLLSFLLSLLLGFIIIPKLRKMKAGQNILCYLTEHFCKSGTPTMGGIVFILACSVIFLIFSRGQRSISVFCLVVFICFGIVGFLDDFIKIKCAHNQGLTPLQKILFQLAVAVLCSIFAYRMGLDKLYIPFTKKIITVGAWIIPFSVFVFLACVNCVNLTDGLDGLASTVSFLCFLFSAVLIYLQTGKMNVYVLPKEYENLVKLCLSASGALLAFLVFNTYKASVFMGDTGSLALGGLFSSILIFSGNGLYIPIMGATFVASGISVIIQVVYFKFTKRRIFLMAPLHHHFQHKGYSESKIVNAYSIVTLCFGLLCILSFI